MKGFRMKTNALPDPASEGGFNWTEPDIRAARARVAQLIVSGEVNPQTLDGEPFAITFADGKTRNVLPRYLSAVYQKWAAQFGPLKD